MNLNQLFTIETTVLNGLPCIVEFNLCPPEPDAGYLCRGVEIVDLRSTNGKTAPWIEDRLTSKDWDRLYTECYQHVEDFYE